MPDLKRSIDALMEATVVPSFSSIGPAVRSRLFSWEDLDRIDMSGKVVLITGGNSGLGFAAAQRLAAMGAGVRIVVRDPNKGRVAAGAITSASGNNDVEMYLADMSSLGAVQDLAAQVWARESRLDVLIHNAGVLLPERQRSVDGYEMTFATAVLGPHLLTREVSPLLEQKGRIIIVSSGGMYAQRLRADDLQLDAEDYKGTVAYAHAKRAQVILAEMWADRLKEAGTVVHSMHPGWADTPGVKTSLPTFRRLTAPVLRDSSEGADTMVFLAAAEEPGRCTGLFWHDRAPRPTHKMSRTRESPEERERLWQAVQTMTASS